MPAIGGGAPLPARPSTCQAAADRSVTWRACRSGQAPTPVVVRCRRVPGRGFLGRSACLATPRACAPSASSFVRSDFRRLDTP